MVMITLSITSFMVSLDACVFVTSLSVPTHTQPPGTIISDKSTDVSLWSRLSFEISVAMPLRDSG